MNLYELKASDCVAFWGEPESPTGVNAITIAQKPDCSAFIVMAETDYPLLTPVTGIPVGYDFTYRQEWGLVITKELLERTEKDLVSSFPGRWPQTESILNVAAIKAKAREIILARLPEHKQRNYLVRKAELQDILISSGKLSESEQAEWDFFTAEWAWVKAVRATSNAAELAGTPVDEVVWPT